MADNPAWFPVRFVHHLQLKHEFPYPYCFPSQLRRNGKAGAGIIALNGKLKPAFCPVVFDQPVIDIAQPVAGRLCILRQLQRLFHLFQIHFVAVIQHRKLNVVFLLFYAKHQLSGLTGFIKAVLQSVFYQGLQQQLDDLIVQHLGVNFIGRAKRVGKPLLLNVQIAADLGQFFRHLQLVDTVIERVAQHLRKIRDHFLNIIGAVFDRHPVDGIQCIVQKCGLICACRVRSSASFSRTLAP